ncbi:MAG: metal-binding protein, partial [Dolichospermum sp.]
MPSGQTHDRITIWSMPVVASITLVSTHSSNMTLLVAGGFMFGGLMFGPDLDIYSRQFQRWGFLRWIWLPYQKSLRHRSFLSHGPIIGTTLR